MLQPIGDMVIVSRDKVAKVSAGGVLLLMRLFFVLEWGTVVAAGPGYISNNGILIPTTVEKGDAVLYDPRLAQEIERLPEWDDVLEPDVKLFVIAEGNIVAKWPLQE